MSDSWQQSLEEVRGVKVRSKQPLGGGDFAASFMAELSNGERIFVKTHDNPPANFFSTEAIGLQWLRDSGTVSIPEVLAFSDDPPFLALAWIEPGRGQSRGQSGRTTDQKLGAALADLHRTSFSSFGRPDCRTTGSLGLPNNPKHGWVEFYASQRLQPLAVIARERGALSENDCSVLEKIVDNLDRSVIANDSASLLHGDLWAGNRLVDSDGQSWLIDPAAHGGHREFDLAMMQLFGGYSADCFAAYHETYPLQAGFEERVPLHQLAPLVVHAIKFGSSYKSAVRQALRQTATLLDI